MAPETSGMVSRAVAESTRCVSSCMVSALGKRSAGFFRSDRATRASTAGLSARLTEDGAGGVSCTCW